MSFTYDYKKTMMMKMFLSIPDRKGGSKVACDFEGALLNIVKLDALTLGVPKIIYLVGWQYNGHDDDYPAFFEVNPALKRQEDGDARESLLWLMLEAKKHNTVVSLHINFTDAYEASPLYEKYLENGALIRNRSGKPAAIENYNGVSCYKIDYKSEWESGLFQARIEKLLELLPIAEAGTLHADNFQCYANRKPNVKIEIMQKYRLMMIDYLAKKGIDITTEFTYREGRLTSLMYGWITREILKHNYPIALLNAVPAVWWVDKLSYKEIFNLYPDKYSGGLLKNRKASAFLYGNVHGEDIWADLKNHSLNLNWEKEFARQFAVVNLPYFYLSGLTKARMYKGRHARMEYKEGVVSNADGTVTSYGKILKDDRGLCFPCFWKKECYIGYSISGGRQIWQVKGKSANIHKVTAEGLKYLKKADIADGDMNVDTMPDTLYYIQSED